MRFLHVLELSPCRSNTWEYFHPLGRLSFCYVYVFLGCTKASKFDLLSFSRPVMFDSATPWTAACQLHSCIFLLIYFA